MSEISGEMSQISGEMSQISGEMSQTSSEMSQISDEIWNKKFRCVSVSTQNSLISRINVQISK